jgi:hypothetical protein
VNDVLDLNVLGIKDSSLSDLFGSDIELTKEFKQNYESWLECEVFNNQIDWDLLITKDARDVQ